MTLDLAAINYLAVVVGVVVNMAGGAAWYSPILFANPWMRAVGVTEAEIRARGSAWRGYVVSIVASIIIAFVLAVLVQLAGATTAVEGLLVGVLAGVGLVATTHAASYAFEARTLSHYLLNAGYPVVTFAVIGAILGFWQ